jgi:hypothetical protein
MNRFLCHDTSLGYLFYLTSHSAQILWVVLLWVDGHRIEKLITKQKQKHRSRYNTREQYKVSGHDGRPSPILVSHLLHLLGHTLYQILRMLIQMYALRVGCIRKPQTKSTSCYLLNDRMPSKNKYKEYCQLVFDTKK